jgi:hypothetical protein
VELLFHISVVSMQTKIGVFWNAILYLAGGWTYCGQWTCVLSGWCGSDYSWQHCSLLIPHSQCPHLPCPLLASWTLAKLEETDNLLTVLLVLRISTKLLSKSDSTIYTYSDSKDLSYSQTTFQHVSLVATTIITAVDVYIPKYRYCKLSFLRIHSQSQLAYPSTQSWLNAGVQHSWRSTASGVTTI